MAIHAPTKQLVPDFRSGATSVVFGDHRFCAGIELDVAIMAQPHRHSQFEINHVLEGDMTYWFDGREVTIRAGETVFFWGVVPHQTTDRAPGTRFICLYIPAALFMGLSIGEALRTALFRGGLVEATRSLPTDRAMFMRWHEDLLTDDAKLESIVRDELGARLRRIDLDGWRDLRHAAPPAGSTAQAEVERSDKVEAMMRFIGDRGGDDISVADVAAVAGLHPNYAMTVFKRALGITITDYVTRHRLDTAQAMLIASDDDIAGIAFAAGFGSLSRFYEAFHQRFDMSPARFRKWHRGGKR